MDNKFLYSNIFTKSDDELICILSHYWNVSEEEVNKPFMVIATYKKAFHKDVKGQEYGYFEDVRNLNGDILYYPCKFGRVRIFTLHKDIFLTNTFWQINVKVAPRPLREKYNNPFLLIMDNAILGKPKLSFIDKINKEKFIRKLFEETGSTSRDAKNISNALHAIMGDLYTETERFVYELFQNADDQPQENSLVNVNLKILKENLLFMHSGKPFSQADVESISSIGDSTKKNDAEKTGYKGIGFKSVFSDSETVFINSGNFSFAFDKKSPVYSDEGDMNVIPWQIKPIWAEKYRLPKEVQNDTCFFVSPVSIALNVGVENIIKYDKIIPALLSEPRFTLFLRNIGNIRFENSSGNVIEIKKKIDDNIVRITSNEIIEDWIIKDYIVDIPIETQDALQNEKLVPKKLKEATKTKITFAAKIIDGNIVPVDNAILFTYLPTKVDDFGFKFLVNADFLTTASRESIHNNNIWNRFLFAKIGELLVEWISTIGFYNGALRLLPLKMNDGDNTLFVEFFDTYQKAILNKSFIKGHNGNIVSQDKIVIDKSGLAQILGPYMFCQILQIKKVLPAEDIDNTILVEEIFIKVELLKFDEVIESITENAFFNEWFISATDEQKHNLYKWIIENNIKTRKNTLRDFVETLPLFQFGNEYKSIKEIESNEYIVTTTHISPIREILTKLNFECSDNVFNETHSLYLYLQSQNERNIFAKIQKSNIESLSFSDRLRLFVSCSQFDEVGKETLRKWPIFRNQNNMFIPLLDMFGFYDTCPEWLYPYMINVDEQSSLLTTYLIPHEDIYSSVIEKHIDSILLNTDILQIYNLFQTCWNPKLSIRLLSNNKIPRLSLLKLVEQSDNSTKTYYIKSFHQITLSSSSLYDQESFEYRWIKLASLSNETITHARDILFINRKRISSYSIKDDFTVNVKGNTYKFSLSKMFPSFMESLVLSKVYSQFSDIDNCDKLFAQSEASPFDVRNILYNYLREPKRTINDEQFCFLMAYRLWEGYRYFESSIKPFMKIYKESIFIRILERTYEMGLADSLGTFLGNGEILYPFKGISGRYFDCDNYTLPSERIPKFLQEWANTAERKGILKRLGMHDEHSIEISRRKSFMENRNENIWNITDTNTITVFLKWVVNSFELPISNENQVKIIESLFSILKIRNSYYEGDFIGAKEWTNELYLKWKEKKGIKICIIDGYLPYRGIFERVCLFKGYKGEYTYFPTTKTIYISSNREPAAVLSVFYSDKELNCVFCKEDWNQIFLVSADIVKEKDKRIAELERLLDCTSRNTYTVDKDRVEISDGFGTVVERDDLEEPSRIELNVEARNAAKEYLDALEDFDCSDWNPDSGNGLVKGLVKYKGKKITLVVTSSIGRKLYLHPRLFAELMTDSDNVLLNYGYDRKIHHINFEETFEDNKDVNLIFDTDIITPKEFAYLANRYMYSKRTCFVIENITYSISEHIKGFGLNEKITDTDVYMNIDLDDVYNY